MAEENIPIATGALESPIKAGRIKTRKPTINAANIRNDFCTCAPLSVPVETVYFINLKLSI
jgi:hypothetical protein